MNTSANTGPTDGLIWSGDLHARISNLVSNAGRSVHVITPYIRLDALSTLLETLHLQDVTVVTTWRTRDILDGSSDLSVYPFIRSRGWYLYVHPRLHAKLYVADLSAVIVSSANVSNSGLGLIEPANVECGVCLTTLALRDRMLLFSLIGDSLLVQDDYYGAIERHISSHTIDKSRDAISDFDDSGFVEGKHFLLSSLPMCDSPDSLLHCVTLIGKGEEGKLNPTEVECALHDMALYELSGAGNLIVDEGILRERFFTHPFIRAFADFVESRRFFGEAKAWVQGHCTNVPVPRRRDITAHVRVLFDWMVRLGHGEYAIERPGYSECLVRIQPDSSADYPQSR